MVLCQDADEKCRCPNPEGKALNEIDHPGHQVDGRHQPCGWAGARKIMREAVSFYRGLGIEAVIKTPPAGKDFNDTLKDYLGGGA